MFQSKYIRYDWDEVYGEAVRNGYKRSFSEMLYAARRMGLGEAAKEKRLLRKNDRKYPELLVPVRKCRLTSKRCRIIA